MSRETMAKSSRPAEEAGFQVTPHYIVTAVLSWLIPGAGHWILGYRVRAVVLGTAILGTFWVGESVLAENMAVTREVHPVFFGLQAGNGFSTLLADALWGDPVHSDQITAIRTDLPTHLNLGILFTSVSGLLNVLLILHVLDPRTWTEAASAASESRARHGASGGSA